MSRRLPGSLLLILIMLGLLYRGSAWAASDSIHSADVLVRVSPLTLLLQNYVTIKVGDFTCELADYGDPLGVCSDLPPGEYQVSAYAEGYIVIPSSYDITIPGDSDDSDDEEDDGDSYVAATAEIVANEFYFRLYENNNQLYMPNLQAMK